MALADIREIALGLKTVARLHSTGDFLAIRPKGEFQTREDVAARGWGADVRASILSTTFIPPVLAMSVSILNMGSPKVMWIILLLCVFMSALTISKTMRRMNELEAGSMDYASDPSARSFGAFVTCVISLAFAAGSTSLLMIKL